MTTTTTTTTTTATTMASIKAAAPDYFNRDLGADYAALTDKDAARANLARSITGCAIQWAHSGNDAHIKFAASLPTKGINAARVRSALTLITCKPRAMKSDTVETITAWADSLCLEIHAALTPAPVNKKAPAAKSTTPALAPVIAALQAGLYGPEDVAALMAALATAPAVASEHLDALM